MTADRISFDVDLETAYRQALRAVEATDLPDDDRWNEGADDDAAGNILKFPSPADTRGDVPSGSIARAVERDVIDPGPRVSPRQILEAALFVGGIELTAEKLASLLKGEFTTEFVLRTLEELNRRYLDEERPYEIRCEERLYRIALRPEFEGIRRRVYGLGPKEVKLTQDALEVLSLIAYRQPVSRAEIESAREGNAGNVLRQLVRRQLVGIQRDDDEPEGARYVTTRRFLEVFGLASLEELPRAEDLNFK